MSVQNAEIQAIFEQVADLIEIKGENPFRVRAYREAARVIGGMSEQMAKLVREGRDLTQYRGIGKDLAEKITEIVETGKLSFLEDLKAELPGSLLDLLEIPDLGPKKVAALYHQLGVSSVDELQAAAENNRVARIPGFGAKSQEKIRQSLDRFKKKPAERMLLADAEPVAAALQAYIKAQDGVKQTSIAGSFRRGKETVGDLDILATCRKGYESRLMKAFVEYGEVVRIDAQGPTKSSVHLRSGLQVDLRIVPRASYGAALHYFTGSKAHNVAVRQLAQEKGLKINEYGVYENNKQIAGESEAGVYETVGLCYIEPELRENRGEIEAARTGSLPGLISVSDIRGDLHTHTVATDGIGSTEEMAEAARNAGYEYLAITEHSRKVAVAGGLNEKQVRRHLEAIDRLNETINGIRLLKGMEVDILSDGSLDLPDTVLKELDLTVCSIHYHQGMTSEKQTERVIRAMDNPWFNILGHPSGRLINRREPMAIDMEAIIEAASRRGIIIELNAQPDRLDLSHKYCQTAVERGVKLAISTDAHSPANLSLMRNGVTEARRGWVSRTDVVNTLGLRDLLQALKRA